MAFLTIGKRRLWVKVAVTMALLLAILVVLLATYDPRPDKTRWTIDVIQRSLQTQSVK